MKNHSIYRACCLVGLVTFIFLVTEVTAQQNNPTVARDPNSSQKILEKPAQDFSYKYVAPSGREGGETIGSAIIIPSVPFFDVGFTCDNIDDYDEVCPFSGSISPDVVYSYTPGTNQYIDIDLCGSLYDTKVFVYENSYTPGSPYACNDDACGGDGFKSFIGGLPVTAGNIYYIVIDGWSGDCGEYILDITTSAGCEDCLECSTPEGEADIQDYQFDVVNGGCNQLNYVPPQEPIYSPIQLNQVICGRSNTYIGPDGGAWRDTDWYEITLTQAGTLYFSGHAPFDLQIILIYNTDCNNLQYELGQAPACDVVTVSYFLGPGTYWFWVGPTVFEGMPQGMNYNIIATLDSPPPEDWCSVAISVPVSNWALFIAIGLIALMFVFRIWRRH